MSVFGEAGSYRWWLNLQITLGVAGGIAWLTGAILEEEFVTGMALGFFVSALLLRFGRRSTPGDPSTPDDARRGEPT